MRLTIALLLASCALAQMPDNPTGPAAPTATTILVQGSPGPAGPIGPSGPAGSDGAPGTPGYSPNSLISGGGVVWTSGLSFSVSVASYYINNTQYSSAATDITLDAADATNDRIDVIAVNSSGTVEVLKGTAAAPPFAEVSDPSTQLQLTTVYIAALATEPSNVTTSDVYHENTEWTTAKSGTPINLASTTNPHAGTKDIEATTAVTGNYAQFSAPAPFDPAIKNNLVFWIRSKAAWASTRSLQFRWMLTTANKGSIVVLNESAFGFVSSNTTAYQQIVIPMSLFAANGLSVDRLRVTVSGSGTGIGWYMDDIILQSGLAAPVAPSGVTWCGAWVATTAYPVNCQVAYSNATWVAMASSTNSAPAAGNANWALVSPSLYKSFGCIFDGGGSTVADNSICYTRLVRGGTVTGWSVVAVGASPACTADVLKIASGTALPTASIAGSALPALTGTDNAVKSTTLTGWTTALVADDIAAVKITEPGAATWVQVLVYYTEN